MRERRGSSRSLKPEACVQRAILDLLVVERVWFERRNTRTVQLPGVGGKMRPVFFGKPGTADIMATPLLKGRICILWIECKAPKGKQSEAQKAFEEEVTAQGHYYLLARSSDEVLEWLKEHR